MASASTRFLGLAFFVVVVSVKLQGVSAQCQGSIPDLVSKCQRFVEKPGPEIPPSPECCAVAKDADVPCLCKLITKDIEKIVSMEKVVYVARTCGLKIPPGMKCGSYTVPPKA